MLSLAIILTVVAGILLTAGIALAGYAVALQVRRFHQSSGSDPETVDGRSAS